jgi:hypothetical protein
MIFCFVLGTARPMNKEEIKQKWDFMRDDAAERGTYMHAILEWMLQDPRTMDFQQEMQNFFDWYNSYMRTNNLVPYRTEWRIWLAEIDTAGSVDLVAKKPDGTFALIDWKRSKEIKRTGYNGKKMDWPFNMLPDSNYGHYQLQLNLYKLILETAYGLTISEMVIPFFHPDVNECVPVQDLQLYLGPVDPATGKAPIMSRIAGPKPKPRKKKGDNGGSSGFLQMLEQPSSANVPDMDAQGHQMFASGRTLQDLVNLNENETPYVQVV